MHHENMLWTSSMTRTRHEVPESWAQIGHDPFRMSLLDHLWADGFIGC